MQVQSSLFSVCPKIRREGAKLVAETSTIGWLLSLTLLWRRVVIDPGRQRIVVTTKRFWCFEKTRTIPFEKVRRIHYQYKDLTPWFLRGGQTHNAIDCFSVRLTLWDEDREVHLFNFVGEGVNENKTALPDWMVGVGHERDYVGTQGQQSRCFVALLEEYTGIALVA